jgi:hypothetical protein
MIALDFEEWILRIICIISGQGTFIAKLWDIIDDFSPV